MSTKKKEIDIRQLIADWGKVTTHLKVRNSLDFKLFKATFTHTFEVLQACRASAAIEKKYMKLIFSAYRFIGTSNTSVDFAPKAAFILTERMLNYCVLSDDASGAQNGASVYVMDGYQEIYLNFNDVDGSLEELTKCLDKKYWDSVSV